MLYPLLRNGSTDSVSNHKAGSVRIGQHNQSPFLSRPTKQRHLLRIFESEHRLALGIEKWSISRLISEQGRHNIGIAALQSEPASPKGTQEGQERLPSPVLRLQPALQRAPRELGMWKNTGTGLHRGGAHGRNDFREPRLLHPPTHAKALNSSTWDIWF